MPAQIILLLDLDQLVPLWTQTGRPDPPAELTGLFDELQRGLLQILASCVTFHGTRWDKWDAPQFALKTFSSTGFFQPLHGSAGGRVPAFQDWLERHWEPLMAELSAHFEAIAETWFWPNSPQPEQYRRQRDNPHRKCEAHQWAQALEEIALLYDWDRPDLQSPVKKFNDAAHHGFSQPSNLVYIFSRLPKTAEEMNRFFGNASASRDSSWSSRDIVHQLFQRRGSKAIMNVFKGDVEVCVNLVETSVLFGEAVGDSASGGKYLEAFQKAFKTFKGQVIDFDRCRTADSIVPPVLNPWFVPKSDDFQDLLQALSAQELEDEAEERLLFSELDKSFRSVALPLPASTGRQFRRRLDMKSPRKGSSTETSVVSSRGASLMRLASQTFEKRRRSDDLGGEQPASKRASLATPLDKEVDREKARLKTVLKPFLSKDLDSCLKKLWECQVQALKRGDSDGKLVALAEVTLASLMACLKKADAATSSPKTIEEVTKANFLVGPLQVGQRKTSQTSDGRIRDHKLQALYRIELHRWSMEDKDTLESEILIHLRQISIWEAPNVMLHFLTDSLTPIYVRDQPDILCQLYDELDIDRHESLPQLYSPSKKHCLSIAPATVFGATSSVSSSGDGLRSGEATQKGLDEKVMKNASRKQLEKLNKRFENTRMQINLESRRPALASTRGGPVQANSARFERIQPVRALSSSSVDNREASSHKMRAKRNLCFESDSPPIVQSTSAGGGLPKKSPRKKVIATPRKKATLSVNYQHHRKRSKTSALTKHLTPQKRHRILAPETPSSKSELGRKTDGILSVQESPNIDVRKQRGSMTPRRTKASLSLRSMASFYSGKVSRNLMKAAEMVAESRFEASGFVHRASLGDGDDGSEAARPLQRGDRRSSFETFFPHLLVRQNKPDSGGATAAEDKLVTGFSTPKKRVQDSQTPIKSVAFDMTPQAPTPKSRGKTQNHPEGILKTPHKDDGVPESLSGGKKALQFDLGSLTPKRSRGDVNKTPLKNRNEIEVRKSPRQLLRLHRETQFYIEIQPRFSTPEKAQKGKRVPSHTITSGSSPEDRENKSAEEEEVVVERKRKAEEIQVRFYSPTKPTKASFKEYYPPPPTGASPKVPETSTSPLSVVYRKRSQRASSSMPSESEATSPRKGGLSLSPESPTSPNLVQPGHVELFIPLPRITESELIKKYELHYRTHSIAPPRQSVIVVSPVKVDLINDLARAPQTPSKPSVEPAEPAKDEPKAVSSLAERMDSVEVIDPVPSQIRIPESLDSRTPTTTEVSGTEAMAVELSDISLDQSVLFLGEEVEDDIAIQPKISIPGDLDALMSEAESEPLPQLDEHLEPDDPPSEACGRPSRRRVSVNRFGIDDITLGEAFSSPVRRTKIHPGSTPTHSKGGAALTPIRSPMPSGTVVTPSPKSAKKRLRSFKLSSRRKSAKLQSLPIQRVMDENTLLIQDIGERPSLAALELNAPAQCQPRPSQPPQSPGKFWAVANISQSPKGEIKMKIERTKKPQMANPFAQRLSRSSTLELGISPRKLNAMIYLNSPSPKRPPAPSSVSEAITPDKLANEALQQLGKENTSSHKFSPLTSMGLYDLTKSPLITEHRPKMASRQSPPPHSDPEAAASRPPRRVSKKLYEESY